ncbi:signal peptidase I [Natronorubrum aibiense]|uniref:Signal peptidase I n=1 Tax=Natronorubrum aibiense TaxID=348826 RepID=A0A5P9P940_9EURY|nr:signal peptidase I [Natronorubrum aibiense]QFU84636.1 signal peptidase I [Natronorubrum aibiense]
MNYKTLANRVGLVLLIALVVPFVIYAVPGVIGAEYSFVVLSGSMAPAIEAGDVVVVADRDPATIETADVITYVRGSEETPVTHRVVGVEETEAGLAFETKGDANSDVDASLVPAANVLGVVVLTIPYIGYAIQAVSTPLGFVLLVAVPLGLLVVTELWSLVRAGRTDAAADGGDSDDTTDSAEPTASEPAASTAAEFTISPTDLRLSTVILVPVAVYAIYVALELQTTLTISIAFAATFSALAAGGLLLAARGDTAERERSPPVPTAPGDVSDDGAATDGGSSVTTADEIAMGSAATDSRPTEAKATEREPTDSADAATAQGMEPDASSPIEWAETPEPAPPEESTEDSE